LNAIEVGRFSKATVLTFRVTGMLSCGDPPAPVSCTLPVYEPAGKPVGFTPTVSVAGVVLLAAAPVSNQLIPFEVPLAATVNVTGVPPELIDTVWFPGTAWPIS
jgi:hypothetical protein